MMDRIKRPPDIGGDNVISLHPKREHPEESPLEWEKGRFLENAAEQFSDLLSARTLLLQHIWKRERGSLDDEETEAMQRFLSVGEIDKMITKLNQFGGGKDFSDIVQSWCYHFPESLFRFDKQKPDMRLNRWREKGRTFLNRLEREEEQCIDYDQLLEDILDVYGEPIMPTEIGNWVIRDEYQKVRCHALGYLAVTYESPMLLLQNTIAEGIVLEYLSRGETLPNKMRLLLPSSRIAELKERFIPKPDDAERNQKLAENMQSVIDEAGPKEALHREKVLSQLEHDLIRGSQHEFHHIQRYINAVSDPRDVLSLILDMDEEDGMGRRYFKP